MTIRSLILAALCGLPSAMTYADDALVRVPSFRSLEPAAVSSVNIDLGPWLLHLAGAVMDDHDPNTATVKSVLAGLKLVQIRSFAFADDFEYPNAEVAELRRQFAGPRWTSLLQAHDRKANQQVDIFIAREKDETRGLALIASDPHQFTVINVAGAIKLEELPALEEQLHIPPVKFPFVAMR